MATAQLAGSRALASTPGSLGLTQPAVQLWGPRPSGEPEVKPIAHSALTRTLSLGFSLPAVFLKAFEADLSGGREVFPSNGSMRGCRS